MFSGLGYLWRAYIYCRSLFLSLYSRFFFLFCEEGNMETETERLTGGCRHKRKVGRKRELKMGAGAEEGGRKDEQQRQIGRSLLFMHPSSETPQPGRMHAHTHTYTSSFLSSSIYHPSLAFCLHTPSSSSSRQPRQVADRQTESWQTGIITCGCLRGT